MVKSTKKITLCNDGFKRVEEGLDCLETFARTSKSDILMTLLQPSAKQGHVMQHFDVKTAFLHSQREDAIYLEQPLEFIKDQMGQDIR